MEKNIERRVNMEIKKKKDAGAIILSRNMRDETVKEIDNYLIGKGYHTRIFRDNSGVNIDYIHPDTCINQLRK